MQAQDQQEEWERSRRRESRCPAARREQSQEGESGNGGGEGEYIKKWTIFHTIYNHYGVVIRVKDIDGEYMFSHIFSLERESVQDNQSWFILVLNQIFQRNNSKGEGECVGLDSTG